MRRLGVSLFSKTPVPRPFPLFREGVTLDHLPHLDNRPPFC